jgi:hypothetical protein
MAAQAGPAPPTTGGLEQRLEDRAVIPVLSLGLRIGGSGELKYDCESSGNGSCGGLTGGNVDYDDTTDFLFEADLLFRVVPKFRLGLGIAWLPSPAIEPDTLNEQDSGHEFDATVVGEGVIPVAPTVGIYLRGQVGASILVAGNDHEDFIDGFKAACTAANPPGATCEGSKGPFVGPTFGFGVGALVLVGDAVGLRAGLAVQFVNTPYAKNKVTNGASSVEETFSLSGNRIFLMVGAEL